MLQIFKSKSFISLVLTGLLLSVVIISLGRVLVPFIIALIIAYIVNPLVDILQRKFAIKRRISGVLIAFLIFMLFLSIPLCVIPRLLFEIKLILAKTPNLINVLNTHVLSGFNFAHDTNFVLNANKIKQLLISNIGDLYHNIDLFSPLARNSILVVEFFAYLALIPLILFYSITNWPKIIAFFDSLIPRSYLKSVHHIVTDIDLMLAAYLRGQVMVMLILAIYYATALSIIGLPSGVIIGILTGFLVFIPYLGILTGFIIALMLSFASATSMHDIYLLLAVFGVGHVLEGSLVTPFLVGGRLGLNPVLIILALLVFGHLFGLVGVLLALPLSAIAVVVLKHVKRYYLNSAYYNEIH